MIRRIDYRTPRGRKALEALRAALSTEHGQVSGGGDVAEVERSVRRILADVRERGDEAVCEWTATLDHARIKPADLRVPAEALEAAYHAMPREFTRTVARIRDSVRRFQAHILNRDRKPVERGGRSLALVYRPLARVGVYVPGGRAFYPSTVLMAAVPALAAGVPQVAIASPPTADGDIHPGVLATCRVCGIAEVYRMGGAQAIGALAYGTESVRPVEKIAGPGNQFIQAAKKMVFGRVDIDSLAGPSEVLIIADASGDPAWLAADLLAQAEHGAGAMACLADIGGTLVGSVGAEVDDLASELGISHGNVAFVTCPDRAAAVTLCNAFGPEHLELHLAGAADLVPAIRNAGAIFVGPYAATAFADYTAGSNHVLPTGGSARFAQGLSVVDFQKRVAVVELGGAAAAALAPHVAIIADEEGMRAHARSARLRAQ